MNFYSKKKYDTFGRIYTILYLKTQLLLLDHILDGKTVYLILLVGAFAVPIGYKAIVWSGFVNNEFIKKLFESIKSTSQKIDQIRYWWSKLATLHILTRLASGFFSLI